MWITDWTTRAACKGTDPDELFVQGAAQNRAKLICRGCPVRTECLADALDNGIEFGVWGGMTERERRALLRRRPDVTSWRDLLERARDEYERQHIRQGDDGRYLRRKPLASGSERVWRIIRSWWASQRSTPQWRRTAFRRAGRSPATASRKLRYGRRKEKPPRLSPAVADTAASSIHFDASRDGSHGWTGRFVQVNAVGELMA